ncbi:hypothetical protein MHIB_23300 [Mycolicibacter hiberniae]|uniref:Uncharacterized protein n=1 Tax=Mycolicibacter hiberniae TaxID=29314 RepID=A0A7I7X346_9MYCO|nr:hypothetical protein MHIB_23300 [Mycolicibacter hiberniae]
MDDDNDWPSTVNDLPGATPADVAAARTVQSYPKDALPTHIAECAEVARLVEIGALELGKSKDGLYKYRCLETAFYPAGKQWFK